MLHTRNMKSVQLTTELRYFQLEDETGEFGLLVVHDGDRVRYTIQIESGDELKAAVESFQEKPVGASL